jgi:hypothetical protein
MWNQTPLIPQDTLFVFGMKEERSSKLLIASLELYPYNKSGDHEVVVFIIVITEYLSSSMHNQPYQLDAIFMRHVLSKFRQLQL